MKNVYIDIETVPGSPWFLEKLAADIQPPSNYKSEEAISKWWATEGKARQADIDKAAALSPFCKIICICFAVEDGPIIRLWSDSEDELLEDFSTELRIMLTDERGFANPRYVGHNISGFDLPRLYQRMRVNRLNPDYVRIVSPVELKPWSDSIIDTMTEFGGKDTKGCSLANLCKEFFIEDRLPDMDGSKVLPLYREGRLAEIADYCEEDVRLVRELAKAMRVVNHG